MQTGYEIHIYYHDEKEEVRDRQKGILGSHGRKEKTPPAHDRTGEWIPETFFRELGPERARCESHTYTSVTNTDMIIIK